MKDRSDFASPVAVDLDRVLAGTESLWRELDGAHVLITGGTGFVGCWLLEAAVWARETFALDLRIDVLARRPERMHDVAPHLAMAPGVRLVHGDIRNGKLPGHDASATHDDRYTHVIHAATETNVALDNPPPLSAFDASVAGTRHVLDLCERDSARRFLLVSSGAVYGRAHTLGRPVCEDDPLAPVRGDLAGAYAIGKIAAEFLSFAHGATTQCTAVAARLFSFIGPYLPFDSGFAAGNFMRDAMASRPILIKGDGTPLRSYLYGADMALWLWTMLVHGQHGDIFNVGSDVPVSIGEFARAVLTQVAAATARPEGGVDIVGRPTGAAPELFAPDVERARTRLGLHVITPLDLAIRRTADWAAQARESAVARPAALPVIHS